MDKEEMKERIQQGLPLFGHSDQPEWVQAAAYRNSGFSQLKFCECRSHGSVVSVTDHLASRLPNVCVWHRSIVKMRLMDVLRFNLVNHPYHGVDPSKYTKKDE